jgi:hypothetical protein
MALTGPQLKQLTAALLDAFDGGGLERLVRFGLEKNLDAIAGGRNLTEKVFNLISWTQANEQVDRLIEAALDENPNNQLLRHFATSLKPPDSQGCALSVEARLPIKDHALVGHREHSPTVVRGARTSPPIETTNSTRSIFRQSTTSSNLELEVENYPPTLLLMHLSDIHFRRGRSNDPYDLDAVLRQQLADDVEEQIHTLGPVNTILVSGDIAYSGHADEYVTASQWLMQLGERLGCESENILTVPGNHDVQRFCADNDITLSVYYKELRACRDSTELDDRLQAFLRNSTAQQLNRNYMNR